MPKLLPKEKVVIIGNGIGGSSVAFGLRELGAECSITVISDEPFPLYSPCVLPNYIAGEFPGNKVFLNTFQDYRDLNIELLAGEKALEIDAVGKIIFLQGGKRVRYDHLVLATGSKPVVPGIKAPTGNIFTLKTLEDTRKILKALAPQSRVVIAGSGLVGIEAAVALAKRNCQVFLVEAMDWILPRAFDQLPAERIQELLLKRGIKIYTRNRVIEIKGEDRVSGVKLLDEEIECDTVIFAVGMRPAVELASSSGVELGVTGGIKVNERMETSIESVYACGDCAETKDIVTGKPTLSLLWGSAKSQGKVIASNLAGISRMYGGSLNLTGTSIFELPVSSVGITAGNDRDLEVVEKEGKGFYCRFILKDGFPAGAQFLGHSEGMGLFTALLSRKLNLRDYYLQRKNYIHFLYESWLKKYWSGS